MGNSPVAWVVVDKPLDADGRLPKPQHFFFSATQAFAKGKGTFKEAGSTLKDFAEAAKLAPETPIQIVGYIDEQLAPKGGKASKSRSAANPQKLALERAKSVAKWLKAQGVDEKRLEVTTSTDARAEAASSMTIIVTGGY